MAKHVKLPLKKERKKIQKLMSRKPIHKKLLKCDRRVQRAKIHRMSTKYIEFFFFSFCKRMILSKELRINKKKYFQNKSLL